MSIEQQLIFLFSALGAINGFLLSGYFLLVKSEKRLSDYFLGGLLLMLSIRILKSVFLHFNPGLFQLFVQIGLTACALIGPFLYLYVVNMTQADHRLKKTWWWYLLPSILFVIWLEVNYPFTGPPNNWGPFVDWIYMIWMVFVLASAYQMRGVFKKVFSKSEKLTHQEVWLLNIFIGASLVFLAYRTSSYTSYIVGAISFSFIFYISILLWLYQRKQKSIASDPPIKYAKSSLSTEESQALMLRLKQLMEKDKPYLDPELSLASLSKQLGVNSKALSQAINQTTPYNYSTYIAQLRVEEAKQLLLSPEHQHFKIASIAYDSGFNSLSSFNATFKKITGITAKEYRKRE